MCLLTPNTGFADWEHKSIDTFLAKYEDLISMPRPHIKKKQKRERRKKKERKKESFSGQRREHKSMGITINLKNLILRNLKHKNK